MPTSKPAEPPAPRVLAVFEAAEKVRRGVKLSRGAGRLFDLLHRLALDVARARAYTVTPDAVTFHLPAVTLAGLLDYHADHVARLGRELERAGLLDFGGHAQNVMGRSMYDGCLWSVKTRSGAPPPRVRADEWKHVWRPDFADDVQAKTGAAREMSELQSLSADAEMKYQTAKTRAASPDAVFPAAVSSPDNSRPPSLKAVAEGLSVLWHVHARHRAREIGRLASAIAAALSEPERRRYWCRELWRAWTAEHEGRQGLQGLGAQLERMAADLAEGAPWRNAGAVLAARLKAGV